MGYNLRMKVWRGDATGGELGDYNVAVEEGEVVLDAIHRLQATQAGDLAVRWNCKAGKCGSCSAEVNGKPCLMCMTRLDQLNLVLTLDDEGRVQLEQQALPQMPDELAELFDQ